MRVRPKWMPFVLGGAWVVLCAGLVALGGVFEAERDEARAALEAERGRLAERAAERWRAELMAQLEATYAPADGAAAGLLLPPDGVLLVRGGRQLLPPSEDCLDLHGGPPGALSESGSASAAYGVATGFGDVTAADPTTRALFVALRDASTKVSYTDAFRALLSARVRHPLGPAEDLGSMAGVLDVLPFSSRFALDHTTALGVLRDGVRAADGTLLPGLQPATLAARHRLTCRDFEFLGEKVEALSRSHGLTTDDFARARARKPERWSPPAVDAPTLWHRGGERWLLVPLGGEVRGARVDPTAALNRAAEGLSPDWLDDPDPWPDPARLSDVAPVLRAPRFNTAARALDQRYAVKVGLLAFCALLTTTLLGLAALLQQRRRQLLDLKQEFLAAVSHELRTPLASIRLMAETLERRLTDDPRARDYPTRIVRDTERLDLLVENILSFNRLDTGRLALRRERVRLAHVFGQVREAVLRTTPHPVVIEIPAETEHTVEGDAALLTLLFLNLTRNAVAYNDHSPPTVKIEVSETARHLTIRVQDDGRGITPTDRPHLFEPFHRGASAGTTRGSGLGLALARRIARLHGGDLRLAQTSPEGSTFEVTLRRAVV